MASPRSLFTAAGELLRTLLLGAVLAGLVEAALVLVLSWPSFEGLTERLRFLGVELGLFLVLAGAFALPALVLLGMLHRHRAEARARAAALLALPPAAAVAWLAFRGPQARQLPGHDAIVASVALLGVVVSYGVVRAIGWLGPRLAAREAVRARRNTLIGLVLVAIGAHVVDERVLPRLYPFFHLGLEVFGLLLAIAMVAAMRAPRREDAALMPWLALVLIGTFLGAGLATTALAREHALATVLLDRAPGGAAIARPLLRARLMIVGEAPRSAVVKVDPAEAPLPPGPRLGSRDVILVTLDALRADRLRPDVMPMASALADGGVRFTDAYTQVPHTSFAVASLLTGKHVYSLSALGLDAASHQTLAQIMRRERYKTAAFFPPAVFFIDHDRLAPLERSAYGFEYVKYEYLDAARRTDQVISYFESERPAHAFVWVHYLEPHEPYDVHPGITAGTPGGPAPAPGLSEAQLRYEGEIRAVDRELGRLVDYLRKTRPGALLVLSADHGEEFGEHGGRYHGTTLYDEQVRVPLVFGLIDSPGKGLPENGVGIGLPARAVPDAVGLVDVTPTILSLLGVPASAKMRGHDLAPFMSAQPLVTKPRPVFAEIDRKKMVVLGSDKLVCDLELGSCAFYDRARDPAERRDVAAERPADADRLRAELDRFMSGEARFEQRAELPPELARIFSRARLGEAQVVPELVAQLPRLEPQHRHEALVLLAGLPAVPGTPLTLSAALSDEDAALLELVRARGGDAQAQARLGSLLDAGPERRAWLTPERAARLALGSRSVPAMARAIVELEDRGLVEELAAQLAATKDPRALDALTIALAPVRSREAVTRAIASLGDPRAIERLARWMPADPYVTVRVAMVHALVQLAGEDAARRAQVREAFASLAATEQEGSVVVALVQALGPGRVDELEIAADRWPALAPTRERLVVPRDPAAQLRVDDGAALPVVDGVVRLPAGLRPRRVPGRFLVLDRPVPIP